MQDGLANNMADFLVVNGRLISEDLVGAASLDSSEVLGRHSGGLREGYAV